MVDQMVPYGVPCIICSSISIPQLSFICSTCYYLGSPLLAMCLICAMTHHSHSSTTNPLNLGHPEVRLAQEEYLKTSNCTEDQALIVSLWKNNKITALMIRSYCSRHPSVFRFIGELCLIPQESVFIKWFRKVDSI